MIFSGKRSQSGSLAESVIRLAAPKGWVTIETIPVGSDGAAPKMPQPLSPAYAALSIDIARARLAAELLTLRTRWLTAPLRLPRILILYMRVRQATTLANAIAASAAAQAAAKLCQPTDVIGSLGDNISRRSATDANCASRLSTALPAASENTRG